MAEQHYSRRETRRLVRDIRRERRRREQARQRKREQDCAEDGHFWAAHGDLEVCTWCGAERDRWNKRRTPPVRERRFRSIGGRRG